MVTTLLTLSSGDFNTDTDTLSFVDSFAVLEDAVNGCRCEVIALTGSIQHSMVSILGTIQSSFSVFPARNIQQYHSVSVRWQREFGVHDNSKTACVPRASQFTIGRSWHIEMLEQSQGTSADGHSDSHRHESAQRCQSCVANV